MERAAGEASPLPNGVSREKRKRYVSAEEREGAKAPAAGFELWLEEAWHGWLRTATLLAAVCLVGVLYSMDVLPESFVATLIALALIGAPIAYSAYEIWQRIEGRSKAWRPLVVAFFAAWAFGAGYPAGCAVKPPHDVDTKVLVKGQTIHLDASQLSGPLELGIRGSLTGGGDADGRYTLEVTSNGVTERVDGVLSRHSNFMRVGRRGSGRVTTERNVDKLPLEKIQASKDVAVSVAYEEQIVGPRFEIAVHARPYPLSVFIALGVVLLGVGMVLDGRLAGRESTYTAMWVAGTMVFALSLLSYSDPQNLVRPAIGALLTAGFAALPAGALLSWMGSRALRPASARRRRR